MDDPVALVVIGTLGLLTLAYHTARTDLERASDLFRSFREQPAPKLAQSARAGLATALSPNDWLQQLYYPWASYVVIPPFALANAGIPSVAQPRAAPPVCGLGHRRRGRRDHRDGICRVRPDRVIGWVRRGIQLDMMRQVSRTDRRTPLRQARPSS